MTGHVHVHRNDGEEVMPAAFWDYILNGESAVAVGDGPGGVSAAGARCPAFPRAENRIPSCIPAPAACFLLFSIDCGNTAGTDNRAMVPVRGEISSRCGWHRRRSPQRVDGTLRCRSCRSG